MLSVADIPSSIYAELRNRFENAPEVHMLRTEQQLAQRRGDYARALAIGKAIEDDLFPRVLDEYMKMSERDVQTLDSETDDIPKEDRDVLMEKLMVLFMVCDIMESAVLDMNDVLHRSKPDIDITTFDDIRSVGMLAKEKLRYLQEKGDYMEDLVWADRCDDMYEMISSKARSILRKRRESKTWGVNSKRLANKR